MANVLIVDDERGMRITLREFIREDGHEVETVADAESAIAHIRQNAVDVVVSDISLPNISGVVLLQRIRELSADIQVILITGEPTVDTAIKAVRSGAFDYLSKPVSGEAIARTVNNAAEVKRLSDENRRLYAELLGHKQELEKLAERRGRALKESEATYRSLVEMASDGICLVRDGILVYTNERLGDILGRNIDELVNRPFAEFIEPADLPKVTELHERHLAGEREIGIVPARLVCHEGKRAVVELNASIVPYDGDYAQLVIVRDVTGLARSDSGC